MNVWNDVELASKTLTGWVMSNSFNSTGIILTFTSWEELEGEWEDEAVAECADEGEDEEEEEEEWSESCSGREEGSEFVGEGVGKDF